MHDVRQPTLFGPRALWIGVHDALSGRLAGSSNPAALWVSSYCVSASRHACPDASFVDASEMLAVASAVAMAAHPVSVVVDCDCGYGDDALFGFVMARYALNSSVAAICIEDKIFPKKNSFYEDCPQELESLDLFTRKIREGDHVRNALRPTLGIVARTEALIAGAGIDVALQRMEAFVAAGADAVMVQAKGPLAELLSVGREWKRRSSVPLLCAPTAYPEVSTVGFWQRGFDVVILANQLLRGAAEAQRRLLSEMLDPEACQSALTVKIMPMSDVDNIVRIRPHEQDRLQTDLRIRAGAL